MKIKKIKLETIHSLVLVSLTLLITKVKLWTTLF